MIEIRADQITVRGNASAEEIAALLATLSRRQVEEPSRYERWRQTRLAALRRTRDERHCAARGTLAR